MPEISLDAWLPEGIDWRPLQRTMTDDERAALLAEAEAEVKKAETAEAGVRAFLRVGIAAARAMGAGGL